MSDAPAKTLDTVLRLLRESGGHAVLLRASQIPLMMTATGQSPLPLPPLGDAQMTEVLSEIVPLSVRSRLRDSGSVDYTVPQTVERAELSITAIGNGDDIWLEVRPQDAPPAGETALPAAALTFSSGHAAAHNGSVATTPPPPAPTRRRLGTFDDLNALIRRLASHSDSSLFLHSGLPPAAKIDGAVEWLEEFEPLETDDLGRILIELSGEVARHGGAETDDMLSWTIPDAALVQCRANLTSPAVQIAFRITSTRPVDAERVRIPPGVLTACREEYGLLVLAGITSEQVARTGHGLVDRINRDCPHHVIVLERQPVTRHQRGSAFLSQRVVTGDDEAWTAALAAALAEGPDVLVTEHVPSWQALEMLLAHAAHTLVIVHVGTASVVTALRTLLALAPEAQQGDAAARLADALTAAMAQCEVKPRGASRIPAYEVMTATPAVRELVRQAAFDQLTLTIERGVDGMVPMSAAIAELERSGRIAPRQAREQALRPARARDLSLI